LSQAKYKEEERVCKETGNLEMHFIQFLSGREDIEYGLCQCELNEIKEETKRF
jgi:hypothetical protein